MVRAVRIFSMALMVLCVLLSLSFIYIYLIISPGYAPDYTVFWTAARLAIADPSQIYDSQRITEAQYWIVEPSQGLRPFAYPPTALLLFVPFSMLPIWWSLACWNALSLATFWIVLRRVVTGAPLYLALISPPVVFALVSGQTALLMAAMVIGGLSWLPRRPILAGAMMGVAAAIKPQNLILAPVAFVSGRHWMALTVFTTSGLATIGLSLVFGYNLWVSWAASLVEFQQILEDKNLQIWGVTPASAAYLLGIRGTTAILIQIIGVIVGIIFVWWAFRQDDLALRTVALVCGGLLSSPYSMRYELAALAPFAASALFSGRPWGLVAALPLTATGAMFTVPAMVLATLRGGVRR